MCFSNIPVEFDEAGNPYLAEDAEEVDRPSDVGETSSTEVPLAEDPETAYRSLVDCVSGDVRAHLTGQHGSADAELSEGD